MNLIVFWFFGAVAVVSAIIVVTHRNPMHSVLYLSFSVLAVSGVFFSLQADFLGAIQIIVYAGGIVVLYTFVIIIINLNELQREKRRFVPRLFLVLIPVVLMAEVAYALYRNTASVAGGAEEGITMEELAHRLMSSYVVPFEIASVLLLAVLVGSIIIARKRVIDDSN